MKYFSLIIAALLRSRTRTLLTLLSIITAFMLFGLLDAVRVAFTSGHNAMEGGTRLVVMSKLSITQFLPVSLNQEITRLPTVERSATATWFGGIYRDRRHFFPSFSVNEDYLDIYAEYVIDPQQRLDFANDRAGAVVGRALAERHGWQVGDIIPLQSAIFPNRDGTHNWPLTLRAIFDLKDPKRKMDENILFMHWPYFNESNTLVKDYVGSFVVQLSDSNQASLVAQAIDRLSENSDRPTRTQTEQAFKQSFLRQFADIGLIVSAIMGAVFFTLLILTGNTLSQAVRERIPELAVLKTLGFANSTVLWLVLAESILLLLGGGLAGMGLASMTIEGIGLYSRGLLPTSSIPVQTWILGLGLMVLMGTVVGLPPALRAMRLKIVDALAGR